MIAPDSALIGGAKRVSKTIPRRLIAKIRKRRSNAMPTVSSTGPRSMRATAENMVLTLAHTPLLSTTNPIVTIRKRLRPPETEAATPSP